jgi:hypothetical protein
MEVVHWRCGTGLVLGKQIAEPSIPSRAGRDEIDTRNEIAAKSCNQVGDLRVGKNRGDKTAIELFVAGVRGSGSWRWRQLENSQST